MTVRLLRSLTCTSVVIGSTACMSIDYVPPLASASKASVTVTSTAPAFNTPIRFHDASCSNKTARRIGWLNSKIIGAPETGDTLTFDVPAGEKIGVSVLSARGAAQGTTFTMTACDRIVDFTPENGARYLFRVEIDAVSKQCWYRLSRVADSGSLAPEPSAQIREGCNIAVY